VSLHCWKQPSARSLHFSLSFAFLNHVASSHWWISSLHLLFGIPFDLFPSLTCDSEHLTAHLLSLFHSCYMSCPFPCQFGYFSRISFVFILSLSSKFSTSSSTSFILSTFLSIFGWYISIL